MPLPTGPRRLQQHAPLLLGALLLAATCAGLAWQTINWRQLLHAEPTAEVTDATSINEAPAIERLEPLFGPAPAGSSGNTPATSLNLVLHGSFVHVDPDKSSAIIQRSGEKPQRFLTGSSLDDNTRLHAVYPDRVEIERNGRIERLDFPSRPTSANGRGQPERVDPAEFNGTQESEDELLQQRMEALREQMEAASELDALPTEQPPESD